MKTIPIIATMLLLCGCAEESAWEQQTYHSTFGNANPLLLGTALGLGGPGAGAAYLNGQNGVGYTPPPNSTRPTIRCTTLHYSWGDTTQCQ